MQADLTFIYDNFDFPDEFLRDSSYWMPVDKMESFLFVARHCFEEEFPEQELIDEMAQKLPELRAWGALDSVLRIMGDPTEIFAQPERFLSYFISDLPHLSPSFDSPSPSAELCRVSFLSPLSSDDYPLTVSYLRRTCECLPLFVGKPGARVSWGQEVTIEWENAQKSLFEETNKTMSPELLQSVIATLQESQKALESKNRELAEMNEKLLKKQPAERVVVSPSSLMPLNGNLQRIKDYFTRANQLITLLVGQDRMNRQVKEAMRRVDWEYTVQEFPKVIDESLNLLKSRNEKSSALSAEGAKKTYYEENQLRGSH